MCQENFDIFLSKNSTRAPNKQAKKVSRKMCGHVVNNYADLVSVYSTTTLTQCKHIQWLRWHPVSEVNDYVDIVLA